jgi:hypothetical protein
MIAAESMQKELKWEYSARLSIALSKINKIFEETNKEKT